MLLSEVVSYLLAGRVSIFMLQMNMALRRAVSGHKDFKELLDCDLCLGFWVYLCIGVLSRQRIDWTDSKLINYLTTASMCATLMHIFRIGWETRFEK